jgi:hypothetical protein
VKNTMNAAQPSQNERGSCWLTRHLEGEGEELTEAAAVVVGEHGAVVVLDDPSVLEHDHLVDEPQRRQPVSDDERGAPGHELGDRGLEADLGLRIDAGGRLVEHDEVGAPQPHPGEGEELGLAGRQARPAGAEEAVDPTRDKGIEADAVQRAGDRLVGRRRVEQRHVLPDRALEQLDLLRDERDPPAQLGHRDVGDRDPAQRDGPVGGFDEAEQQAGECGLAAAGPADDPDGATGGDIDVDVVENRASVAVAECHAPARDRERPRRWRSRPSIDNRRLDVEQFDHAHHRPVGLLHRLQLVDELLERA